MKIDQIKIKAKIHTTVAAIKKHKSVRKLPPGGWPCIEEQCLRELATTLCCIQAHRRGKIHMNRLKSLEEQAELIAPLLAEYEIREDQPTTELVA